MNPIDAALENARKFTDGKHSSTAYLCGPMTGHPGFNFPAFDDAAYLLRKSGYVVVSPAELDEPAMRAAAIASPDGRHDESLGDWKDYLARDISVVCHPSVDMLIVLEGWNTSRGACLETYVASSIGKPIFGVFPIMDVIDRRRWAEEGLLDY